MGLGGGANGRLLAWVVRRAQMYRRTALLTVPNTMFWVPPMLFLWSRAPASGLVEKLRMVLGRELGSVSGAQAARRRPNVERAPVSILRNFPQASRPKLFAQARVRLGKVWGKTWAPFNIWEPKRCGTSDQRPESRRWLLLSAHTANP